MRHRTSGRRLGVPEHRRRAMMKQLVEALYLHGRIQTTLARAKETKSLAEKMITLAKKGTLHHRRQAMALISRKDVVNRLFDHMVEWYKDRAGGYTRIIKVGNRAGDGAQAAFLELVDWVPGQTLPGQHTKQIKVAESEEEKEKRLKKEKKDKKAAGQVAKEKEKVKKVAKSGEQQSKISERQAAQEKVKKERAAQREKVKKEITAGKEDRKKAAKSGRNTKKKLAVQVTLQKKAAKKKAAKKKSQ